MPKRYKVNINGSHEFDFTQNDIDGLNISKSSDSKVHVIINNQSLISEIVDTDFHKKSYKVKLQGKLYNVLINNNLDLLINEMGFDIGASKNVDSLNAPMPGLILEILATKGKDVNENDPLLILEAMKMENVLLSPRNGTIKNIRIKTGDTVDKNELLIEFEQH